MREKREGDYHLSLCINSYTSDVMLIAVSRPICDGHSIQVSDLHVHSAHHKCLVPTR